MKKLLLTLVLPTIALAEEPTKEQTIEFLQEKLNTVSKKSLEPKYLNYKVANTVDYKVHNSFKELSNCVFEVKKYTPKMDYINKVGGEVFSSTVQKIIFNAKNLDPETLHINQNPTHISVVAIKRKKKVQWINELYTPQAGKCGYVDAETTVRFTENNKCIQEYKSNIVSIGGILSPEDVNAPKVARAFKHLIKLCGGKGELF